MRTHRVQPLRLQSGFTLIELVMVIVILAVLAAVAIPKFVDLGSEAKAAALSGVAGSLTSASAVNYAARKVNSSNGTAVANCTDVAAALQGGLPSGYVITSGSIAANATESCTLTPSSTSLTARFTAQGIN